MDKRGFTLIELIMIILIIGILAVVAIPRYIALQNQARQAAEEGVVGAVRGGIHIYRANRLSLGFDDWPDSLENTVTDPTDLTIFEGVVDPGLSRGGTDDWTGPIGAAPTFTYTAPDTTTYVYTTTAGTFE